GMPKEARVFLLALAIFDDLIAILIIAVFFTADLQPSWLIVAIALAALLALTERLKRAPHTQIRIIAFLLLWYSILQSGIHPTIAGVVTGLLIPAKRAHSLIDKLQPVTNSVILPVFAFSAVAISLPEFAQAPSTVFVGIILALPVGKTLGIALFALLANRIANIDNRLKLGAVDFVALGAIAGVGFTVSLLMTQLAFENDPQLLAEATIAVVIGSLISMGLGAVLISNRAKHYRRA
ncbi:MAG: Na+/H+ antiporter NhaA, partial [Actinomycetota bacterium]